MDELYFVIRTAKRQDGTITAPAETRTTLKEAYALFYTRAGQAVASDYIYDAVILADAHGHLIDGMDGKSI